MCVFCRHARSSQERRIRYLVKLVFRARSWIGRSDQSQLVEGWDMDEARKILPSLRITLH